MDMPYQAELPIVEPARNVVWTNGERLKSRRFFGRNTIRVIQQWDHYFTESTTTIQAGEISKIKDPDLRYALRYKDAVEAVGWVYEGEGSSSKGYVAVIATDNGDESKLLSASYSGNEDESFIDWLRIQGEPQAVNENN